MGFVCFSNETHIEAIKLKKPKGYLQFFFGLKRVYHVIFKALCLNLRIDALFTPLFGEH